MYFMNILQMSRPWVNDKYSRTNILKRKCLNDTTLVDAHLQFRFDVAKLFNNGTSELDPLNCQGMGLIRNDKPSVLYSHNFIVN